MPQSLSQLTIELAGDAVFWTDSRGKFQRVNQAACRELGYTREELLTLSVPDINPDYHDLDWKSLRNRTTRGEPLIFETRHRRKDGSMFPVEISIHFIQFQGREYACSFARNITQRKRADLALENALREVERLKDRLQVENRYLRSEIKSDHNFEEIITEDPGMRRLLNQVTQVAKTSATVLILGETGTGKELIARAIHNAGSRKDRPLVKLNCAAIPETLLESELFGHERGAFTGATARKIGRFEMADGGTIFLDEIGEISSNIQSKLLRVLQEGDIQRLGGTGTVHVDTRVIAATNRNLEQAMDTGSFREDLYYRLNVFPITCPPLRQRPGDIPVLAAHFVKKFSLRLGKAITGITEQSLAAIQAYHWPGNIRELENILERAVILATGPQLDLLDYLPKNTRQSKIIPEDMTLRDMEIQMITSALTLSRGMIEGKRGAARRLDIPPSTLRDKIKRYGITIPAKG